MTAPRASSPLAGTGLGAACLGLSLLALALPNPVNAGCPPPAVLAALSAAAQGPAYASAETRGVIERMVEAHGGMAAWRQAPTLAYDVVFFNPYAAAGENPWWIYREVVEQRTRRAYHAWPVEGARLGYDGARVWTTDWAVDNMPEFMVHFFYYFVNLPWLSQDGGIRLGPVERVRLPGIPTDLLAVPWTFDSAPTVGKTARDSYRLFIEPESHLLRGYEYSIAYPPMIQAMGLPAGGVMGPLLRIHDAFTEVGGLRFPSRFRTLSPDGKTTYGHHIVTNYSVTEPFDESRLAPPAGAIVARSDAAGMPGAGRTDLSGWVVPAVGAGIVLVLLAGLGLVRRHGPRRGGP
jgi:hypothetical protein